LVRNRNIKQKELLPEWEKLFLFNRMSKTQ